MIVTALWAWLAAVCCAGAEVALSTDAAKAYVNEPFLVRILVQQFQECDAPTLPASQAYTVRQVGPSMDSSSYSNINGRVTLRKSRTYAFEVTPRQVGDLTIPAASVNVDGHVLETKPVKITVQPSDAGQLFWAEISAGRSRIYVGQRVKLTLAIWVKPANYGGQVLSAQAMSQWVQPINLGPFQGPVRADQRPRPGDSGPDTYYVYEMTTDFVPERPGPLSFDNMQVGISYPARGGARQLRARPTVAAAEVLPVPTEGRPAEFSGAVGLFDIAVSAAPTGVRVGDPIELTIEVFGDGPVESLPPPLLSANRQLNEDFRVPDEKLAGEVRNGRRRFSVTIRPKHEGVTAIPAIAYPYFDPDAERFVTPHSRPIPLTVAPAAETVTPQVPGGAAGPPGAPGEALQPLDGLHDIETSEAALLATTRPLSAGLVTGVALLPAATFLVVWGALALVQRQGRDPRRQRRRSALRIARQRIGQARGQASADLAREVAAALLGYLADRTDEPPARFIGQAAHDFLKERGVAADALERWAGVMARCDEAAFAGGTPQDADTLVRQALDCLAALEREQL